MKKTYCQICRRRTCNDEIALNIKIFGKQIGTIRCYDCLSKFINCDVSKLKEVSEFYKSTGCIIFRTQYTLEGDN